MTNLREPTPRTDAVEVDLNECISFERVNGRNQYVTKYVPVSLSRTLEIENSALREKMERYEAALREIASFELGKVSRVATKALEGAGHADG